MKIPEFFRSGPQPGSPRYNGRTLDRAKGGVVDASGSLHPLRPQSIAVLEALAAREGEIVGKDTLFAEVWPDTAVTDDSLTQCVADIRRALGDGDRIILETIPRRGFRLHADAAPRMGRGLRIAATAGLCAAAVLLAAPVWRSSTVEEGMPTVTIHAGDGTAALATELGAALDHYGGVRRLLDDARFVLDLAQTTPDRIAAELTDTATSTVLMARALDTSVPPRESAIRLAAQIASWERGAIAAALAEAAKQKPLALLSPYECYLQLQQWDHSDAMLRRAETCLNDRVATDPGDARAHALLATLYAEQYWYGSGLDDAIRGDLSLRPPLKRRALLAVEAAEAAGLPDDGEIHKAISRAYYANCKRDHLIASIRRAIELTPDDPNILGAAGNWLSYAGDWDIGVPMAQRAIDLAGPDYARWWYWPLAKDAWRRGDNEAALDLFMRGYMENDWHTHLHLAYTLPLLGRMDDAREQVARLREVYPGFTRETAQVTHSRWCFEQDFLDRMDAALALAGLPGGGETAARVAGTNTD